MVSGCHTVTLALLPGPYKFNVNFKVTDGGLCPDTVVADVDPANRCDDGKPDCLKAKTNEFVVFTAKKPDGGPCPDCNFKVSFDPFGKWATEASNGVGSERIDPKVPPKTYAFNVTATDTYGNACHTIDPRIIVTP
jgi:hypothetical protein